MKTGEQAWVGDQSKQAKQNVINNWELSLTVMSRSRTAQLQDVECSRGLAAETKSFWMRHVHVWFVVWEDRRQLRTWWIADCSVNCLVQETSSSAGMFVVGSVVCVVCTDVLGARASMARDWHLHSSHLHIRSMNISNRCKDGWVLNTNQCSHKDKLSDCIRG